VPQPRPGSKAAAKAPPKADVCPHCGETKCYHCHNCGADTYSEEHKRDCPGYRSPVHPICVACKGTGRTSNNKRCHPCKGTGRQSAYNDPPRAATPKAARPAAPAPDEDLPTGLWG
jgi:DnaJ-class molecular chaperone